ncbi:Uncharacterised protein [Vibrio cholerae]|nr:Uncharacterised protein [Vibrio cholerae]CSD05488.1 Uncharacterised protein [Vibrio cholerae]
MHDRKRNTRQSRPRTHINKALTDKMRTDHQTIKNVFHQHFHRIPHGSEVISFVPFVEQLHIPNELLTLLLCHR